MKSRTQPRLTAKEVEIFKTEGYLLYKKPVLSSEKFNSLSARFDKILERKPDGLRPENLDMPHLFHPDLLEWIFDDNILDLVEPLLGPDLALFASGFFSKPKGDGRQVAWHEDSFYWKGRLDPMEVCTVWLALDKSDKGNGCMKVIPGTHLEANSNYRVVEGKKDVFGMEILPEEVDETKAVCLELEPNEASLHHCNLVHSSEPNTSDRRRCGYTIRFVSTRTKVVPRKDGFVHPFYLARGRDHAGNPYCDPTKVNEIAIQGLFGRKPKKSDAK